MELIQKTYFKVKGFGIGFEVAIKAIDNYPSFLSLCEIAKAVDNDFNADDYFNRSYFLDFLRGLEKLDYPAFEFEKTPYSLRIWTHPFVFIKTLHDAGIEAEYFLKKQWLMKAILNFRYPSANGNYKENLYTLVNSLLSNASEIALFERFKKQAEAYTESEQERIHDLTYGAIHTFKSLELGLELGIEIYKESLKSNVVLR